MPAKPAANLAVSAANTPASTPVAAPAPRQPSRALARPLTRAVQAEFIEELARWGNVRAAAQRTGLSRANLYRMRRACTHFRSLWDAALVLARPQVEEVLSDRALNGVKETVFYHGEEVATRIRYDGRLLLAHLARLDRLQNTGNVYRTVNEFDDKLADLKRLWEVKVDYPADTGDLAG